MNVFLGNDSWVALVNDAAGAAKSEEQQREPTRHTPEAHVLNTRNSQACRTAAVTI
jgi:hypothetical protein